jgi:ribonuclease R
LAQARRSRLSRESKNKGEKPAPFPTQKEVLRFIQDSPRKVGKREIARAFSISGDDRKKLKKLLKKLGEEGLIERGHRKSLYKSGELPPVAVVEITDTNVDGELYARPVNWEGEQDPPSILMASGGHGGPALGPGNRVLAKLRKTPVGHYQAQVMRRIADQPDEVLGVFNLVAGQGRIIPTDRRIKREFVVAGTDTMGAVSGEVVLAETMRGTRLGLIKARIKERLGSFEDPRSYSLIAIRNQGIPTAFAEAALIEAEAATAPEPGKRLDMRELPLITIDPADARDHDDAVWATPDVDQENPGGWKIVVAIADVAAFVRPGTALDHDARKRGNSAYFPDRVVPMLPDSLSSDLCSLREGVDRTSLAVTIWIDAQGTKRRHEFTRGMIRVAANMNYRMVQYARENPSEKAVSESLALTIEHLYGAFAALKIARASRQPLDIELPELRVALGPDGYVEGIYPRTRWESHRLIEEFMIAANVAAAETLEEQDTPCIYRIHDRPNEERVAALRELLSSLDLQLAKGQAIKPEHFNQTLNQVANTPHVHLVNEVILRTQTQALYSPVNNGHFGLNLHRYAHFTSPIRRYADLIVHRSLISALKLGNDGLKEEVEESLSELGDHLSSTERQAAAAEREATNRYLAAFLEDRRGAEFSGRISGVTRFGLFVTLDELGADGLVPIRTLGDEYYLHVEERHALVGERTGQEFTLGTPVNVRLVGTDTVTGSISLELIHGSLPEKGRSPKRRQFKGRGKPRPRTGRRRR